MELDITCFDAKTEEQIELQNKLVIKPERSDFIIDKDGGEWRVSSVVHYTTVFSHCVDIRCLKVGGESTL